MQELLEILFVGGNPGKISDGEKAGQIGNVNCHIFGTESHRKLKFGGVSP